MEFCPNCGQPLDPVTGRCPVCSPEGSATTYYKDDGSFGSRLKAQLDFPLLTALAVLETLLAVFTLLDNTSFKDFSFLVRLIVPAVYALSFWLIRSAARSDGDSMKLGGLKLLSVTLTVIRVILWIGIGILVVSGIIFIRAPAAVDTEIKEMINSIETVDLKNLFGTDNITTKIGIFLLVAAAISVIANLFYFGNISIGTKSVLESFETNQNKLERFGRARIWLTIIGIIAIIRFVTAVLHSGSPDNSFDVMNTLRNLTAAVTPFVAAFYAGHISKLIHKRQ